MEIILYTVLAFFRISMEGDEYSHRIHVVHGSTSDVDQWTGWRLVVVEGSFKSRPAAPSTLNQA